MSSEVGVYTLYAFIGMRSAKIPIPPSLTHQPHDWPELKDHLLDRARKAFNNYGTVEAVWSLEKHVGTKTKYYTQTTRFYMFKPFYWARNVLAYFQIEYIHTSDEIRVKRASFSPAIQNIAQEYREIEKGLKHEVKPIVPKSFKSFLEDPAAILREHSALRYPDYSKTPRLKYSRPTPERHTSTGSYLPFAMKLRRDKGDL